MSRLTVSLVANDLPTTPDWVGPRLSERGIELRERTCANPAEVVETAGDADDVCVMGGSPVLTAEVLHHLHRCRVILRTATGTDNIAADAATHRGILVANTPEATMHQVAKDARFWRVGPATPTRPPGLPLALWRLDQLPCCRTSFACEQISPSTREWIRFSSA